MIVSHKLRFAYAGPPKTATTSVHAWLQQPVLGSKPWLKAKHGYQHRFADHPSEYYRFATVRHPLDRAVSLWMHSQRGGRDGGLPEMTFTEFVDWLPNAPPFYSAPQVDYLTNARIDSLVYCEALEAELLRLPPLAGIDGLDSIPRLNGTSHHPWWTYYTPEIETAVREHFRVDFERYY